MNYQMLKSIIDSLVQNFRCPDCETQVTEKDVEIVWAAWKTVNIDIWCPKCSKHTMVKAEVSSLNIWNLPIWDKESMDKLRQELIQKISTLKWISWVWEVKMKNKEIWIDEKQIMDLRKKLKWENISASDFFS